MHTRTWNVLINLYEDDHRTKAVAVLRTDRHTEVSHVGIAHRRPHDPAVAEIGDELATCRALSGLVHDLLDATIADIRAADPDHRAPKVALD